MARVTLHLFTLAALVRLELGEGKFRKRRSMTTFVVALDLANPLRNSADPLSGAADPLQRLRRSSCAAPPTGLGGSADPLWRLRRPFGTLRRPPWMVPLTPCGGSADTLPIPEAAPPARWSAPPTLCTVPPTPYSRSAQPPNLIARQGIPHPSHTRGLRGDLCQQLPAMRGARELPRIQATGCGASLIGQPTCRTMC